VSTQQTFQKTWGLSKTAVSTSNITNLNFMTRTAHSICFAHNTRTSYLLWQPVTSNERKLLIYNKLNVFIDCVSSCSASWRWASNARNVSRFLSLIKCKWKWSVYQVVCVYYVITPINKIHWKGVTVGYQITYFCVTSIRSRWQALYNNHCLSCSVN
jgi:hypothetical protein